MLLRVYHRTRYDYSDAVSFSPHILYLRPRESPLHRLRRFDLRVSPGARLLSTSDAEDNVLIWAHFQESASRMEVTSEFEIETLDANPFDFILTRTAVAFPFHYGDEDRFTLAPYLAPPFAKTQEELRSWLGRRAFSFPDTVVSFLNQLNQLLHRELRYMRRDEKGIQPSARTLETGCGSCRDYAVVLIELCRTFGIAARFVSGYVHDLAPENPGIACNGDMHAWAEVYLPGAGWKGLDPTRGIFCDDSFVPVAHAALGDTLTPVQGRYYSDARASATLTTDVRVSLAT